MFTWTGGEDIPDHYKSKVQLQPSVESASNASVSHYEISSDDDGVERQSTVAWDRMYIHQPSES